MPESRGNVSMTEVDGKVLRGPGLCRRAEAFLRAGGRFGPTSALCGSDGVCGCTTCQFASHLHGDKVAFDRIGKGDLDFIHVFVEQLGSPRRGPRRTASATAAQPDLLKTPGPGGCALDRRSRERATTLMAGGPPGGGVRGVAHALHFPLMLDIGFLRDG